jgi:hypothetical protein
MAINGETSMYDPVVVRAKINARDYQPASIQRPRLVWRWKYPARTAIVAFAAGWLAASIF